MNMSADFLRTLDPVCLSASRNYPEVKLEKINKETLENINKVALNKVNHNQ